MAQRDDERYPTLAGPGELLIGSPLPEAVPRPPEMLDTSHDKMLSISSAEEGRGLREPPASPRDRICGLRKTAFWLSLILAIAVIGAAVGGGVGGSLASKNNHSEQVSTPSTSPTSFSGSPTATGTTSGTPSATIRNAQAIAVAGTFTNGGSTVNLQVFHQDIASGNITYYLYLSEAGWQNPQNASLLVTPKNGTSLAATATADSADNTYVSD
jgi:hypothetical protein